MVYVPDHLTHCALILSGNGSEAPMNLPIVLETCQAMYQFKISLMLLTVIVGIPGATAVALTMLSMDRTPTTLYMTCLAIGDLVTILLRTGMLQSPDRDLETLKQMVSTFPYNILVLIAFERFMAVKHPFIKRRVFTQKTTKLTIVMAAFLCVLKFLVIIFLRRFGMMQKELEDLIMGIFMFAVPCPLILLFNCLTISSLKTLAIQQQQRLSGSSGGWSAAEASVIYLIVSSSVAFVILNGPVFYVSFIWYVTSARDKFEFRREIYITRIVAVWCSILHHALTFYIYVLGTKRFRKQFLALVARTCVGRLLVQLGLAGPRAPTRQEQAELVARTFLREKLVPVPSSPADFAEQTL